MRGGHLCRDAHLLTQWVWVLWGCGLPQVSVPIPIFNPQVLEVAQSTHLKKQHGGRVSLGPVSST